MSSTCKVFARACGTIVHHSSSCLSSTRSTRLISDIFPAISFYPLCPSIRKYRNILVCHVVRSFIFLCSIFWTNCNNVWMHRALLNTAICWPEGMKDALWWTTDETVSNNMSDCAARNAHTIFIWKMNHFVESALRCLRMLGIHFRFFSLAKHNLNTWN